MYSSANLIIVHERSDHDLDSYSVSTDVEEMSFDDLFQSNDDISAESSIADPSIWETISEEDEWLIH